MIVSFRSKTLKRFYQTGSAKGLPGAFAAKIDRALLALDNSASPDGLRLPGFGLHPLTGDLEGVWSIAVSRNWRIVFKFDGENVADVDFVDYH